jgi:hypothetical protein
MLPTLLLWNVMRVGLVSTRPPIATMCTKITQTNEHMWARIEENRQAREQIKLDLVDTITSQKHTQDAYVYAQLERQFHVLLKEDDKLRKELATLIKAVLAKR